MKKEFIELGVEIRAEWLPFTWSIISAFYFPPIRAAVTALFVASADCTMVCGMMLLHLSFLPKPQSGRGNRNIDSLRLMSHARFEVAA